MIKEFEEGSREIVEVSKGKQIIHLRLGKSLNFVEQLLLVDGTIIQNMQYELDAQVPCPNELLERLNVRR